MYLKTHLIVKDKSLLGSSWGGQSSLLLDTPVLLASLFYLITGKLFESYGVAAVLILIAIVLCMNSILKMLNIGVTARLFAINILLSLNLINGYSCDFLGYSECFLVGPAFYNLRGLTVLLIIREYLVIKNTNKSDFFVWAVYMLCVLSGVSCGVYLLVVIVLPMIASIFDATLKQNCVRELIKKEAVFTYLTAGCVVLGKLLTDNLLYSNIANTADTARTWTSIADLPDNALAPLLGYMKLIGILPVVETNIPVLSVDGVMYIFPMCIIAVLVMGIVRAVGFVRQEKKDTNCAFIRLLLIVILVNYVTFALFNVVYASFVFEERYLVSTHLIVLILLAFSLDKLNLDELSSNVIYWGLLTSILVTSSLSDVIYARITNDNLHVKEIAQAVKEEDAELIYVWGRDLGSLERVMRIFDLDHDYKSIWVDDTAFRNGDSFYCENPVDYSGSTLLVVANEDDSVPDWIMEQYTVVDELEEVTLYRSNENFGSSIEFPACI